jgi:hypothetical protein
VTCDIYKWERMAGRSEGPRLSVEPLSFVIAVEQLVLKTTVTLDEISLLVSYTCAETMDSSSAYLTGFTGRESASLKTLC